MYARLRTQMGATMYRILLVDDEWLELDTLEHYIPWKEMGFEVAGAAANGQEALKLLESLEKDALRPKADGKQPGLPDVLLTDVKMPVMDGIALSREVHRRYPRMQILFLSGYSDFEYVRQALAVEACGYILKPLDLSELQKTMEKVREKCALHSQVQKSQTAAAAENMKSLLGFFGERKAEEWDSVCQTCNIYLRLPLDNRHFYLGLLTIDEYRFLSGYASNGRQILHTISQRFQSFTDHRRILSFHIHDAGYLLLSGQPLKENLEHFFEEEDGNAARWMTACVYLTPQIPEHFPSLYEEMSRYRQWYIHMYGSGHVIVCDTFSQEQTPELTEQPPDFALLVSQLRENQMQDALVWLKDYCRQRKKEDGSLVKGAVRLVDQLYDIVLSAAPSLIGSLDDKAELYGKLTLAESASLIEAMLASFLTKISNALAEAAGDRRRQLIEQVQQHICREYASPLTIESLAERVYMSPNYLRTLFKDYTGETVLEYLTRIRIEASVHLLSTTNLRVHDISSRIGYENPSHFCAVFKKQTGMTPNQFRNQAAKETRYDH